MQCPRLIKGDCRSLWPVERSLEEDKLLDFDMGDQSTKRLQNRRSSGPFYRSWVITTHWLWPGAQSTKRWWPRGSAKRWKQRKSLEIFYWRGGIIILWHWPGAQSTKRWQHKKSLGPVDYNWGIITPWLWSGGSVFQEIAGQEDKPGYVVS